MPPLKTETRMFTVAPSADTDERLIAGWACRFGQLDQIDDGFDSFMERWMRGAFARSIAERGHKVRALWSHDHRRFPIGTIVGLEERAEGLWIEIKIPDTPTGDELLALVRSGAIDGFSVGFKPRHVVTNGKDAASGLRIHEVHEAGLIEVSLVSFPALDGARVLESRSTHTSPYAKDDLHMKTYQPNPELRSLWRPEDHTALATRDALIGADGVVAETDIAAFDEANTLVERADKVAEVRAAAADPRNKVLPGALPSHVENHRDLIGDPFARSWGETESKTRDRAHAAIERAFTDADSAQAATQTLRSIEGSDIADHLIATSDPAYARAFRKHLADPETGYQGFTSDERQAWGRVRDLAKRTALDLAGSVLPSPLDPSIVLTNAGTIDPMRSVARLEKTTSRNKRFVASAGVTVSWDGEGAETSDDTPSLTEVDINTHKAQGFVQASIEAAMDQPDWGQEVVRLFADAKARIEGSAFINGAGDGSDQPTGLWTALNGGSYELSPGTVETFVAADVYSTIQGVPARHRQNAKWMAELSTLNEIDQFETTNGAKQFLDTYSKLLGKQVIENSNVAAHSAINTAASADNPILYAGDFKSFVILDRVGMTVEYVPHIFDTNANLPSGTRGWYAFWRVGSGMVGNGIAVMNIATTA